MGIDELRTAIIDTIEWTRLDRHVSPRIFRRLRSEIIALKDAGHIVIGTGMLRTYLAGRVETFSADQLDTVIRWQGLAANAGRRERVASVG